MWRPLLSFWKWRGAAKLTDKQKKNRHLKMSVVLDQLVQSCNCFLLINAVSDQGDDSALGNAQRQNTQQALSVDAALFLLDPDAALELVGLLDEIGSGTGMQADLILHSNFLSIHRTNLLYTQRFAQ